MRVKGCLVLFICVYEHSAYAYIGFKHGACERYDDL